jgi:hypothetical protein
MDDIFHQEGFFVTFPVWLIGDSTGEFRGMLKVKDKKDGSVALLVFTDNDLAESFVESAPQPAACRLISIPTTLAFIGLLTVLERQGIKNVAFDPTRENFEPRSVSELQDEFIRGIK